MFTGIVQTTAEVIDLDHAGPGRRLTVRFSPRSASSPPVEIGESMAVAGCCLTVVSDRDRNLSFEVGPETLERTTLGSLSAGALVNIERSLRIGDSLGGHFVTGHIDGTGWLESRHDEGDWSRFCFRASPPLTRQMVSKGSIAIDGVSLTLVDVEAERFSVALIPHTLQVTTLGRLAPEERVNLETDLLAKYVEKLISPRERRS